MKSAGTVYLVGAGPGDYGLLTVRAAELIEKADCIIYDNLVNPKILAIHAQPTVEKIYVGKSSANHTLRQEDINELLVEKARTHKIVVRLKGGDPYIFGRGGEEALTLAEQKIPFEVVNGISSAYAVPTYAGIPVTHRGIAVSVAFITGHEDPTKDESDIQWDKLSTGVQTLVFLMGVKNLPLIVQELLKNGRPGSTPIAIIQKGTYPSQKTVVGTLNDIIKKIEQEKISPPSIIVVGEVVKLRDSINWFETRPLFGKTVIVTRAREQASDVVFKLTELGARVIEAPSIKIAPPDDTAPIQKELKNLSTYSWIIFTSANGVTSFFNYLKAAGFDARALHGNQICAIGPATAEQLNRHGVRADLIPPRFISESVIESLQQKNEISGKSFLLPRTDIAPEQLKDDLLKGGATQVTEITVYRTIDEDLSTNPEVMNILQNSSYDLVTFTSSSTVRNFARLAQQMGIHSFQDIPCIAIGPITAETARELGFKVEGVSEVHTIEGLVESVVQYFK